METKLKDGKYAEIWFDDEKDKYEIKTNVSEITYIFSTKKRAYDMFLELEKRYKIKKQ